MKGQAAVEFFMTYGWAILILIIVLGVLVSSGIFSPNYLVSEECSFGTNLKCDFFLQNTGGATSIGLRIFNGFPYKIRISNIVLKTLDGAQEFSGFPSNIELQSGDSYVFNGTLSGPEVPSGNIKRFEGNITYQSCAAEVSPDCNSPTHLITGRVTGKPV
jgi:hypothetical protein